MFSIALDTSQELLTFKDKKNRPVSAGVIAIFNYMMEVIPKRQIWYYTPTGSGPIVE